MSDLLPDPQLTLVYRLEAVLGEPLELGEVSQGRRRIVPQIGGTFEGVLRSHRMAVDQSPRDSARFSITAAEWPAVRQRLADLAARYPADAVRRLAAGQHP